jgi:class 3 adenylate cyclase/tetratricopeptide (TPR) repeat protein/type II secretory pathway predicted ATPase ExeA
MNSLPSGTVTFLFTDIEGSTRMMQQHPDAMKAALARHNTLLQQAIAGHGGHVFQVLGDGFCASFHNAGDALAAALDAQRMLHRSDWGEVGAVRVRMGLHTGSVEARGNEYDSSLTLARVQRVMTAGHGGQTLLSASVADIVRDAMPDGTTLRDLGQFKLRGIAEAENLYQFVAADLPSEFPPLRVEDSAAASAAPLEQLIRGRLVGRGNEQLQLQQHWANAQQARGQLVLLSGEPGVGKTRLAQDLVAHAQKSGATLLRGGCYEYEATTPYLPFVEAFREWTRRQSPDQLRAALGTTAPEIAKLAPEIEAKLGALAPNPPLSPSEERMRLFDNVARLLRGLAAQQGMLVFIDDVHWADQGTLSLLHYLLRHLRSDRVLFLVAYREIELDRAHPLASALVEWNRERLGTRISLGRLTRAETGTLLATLFGVANVPDDFIAALYRETEGNPFFIEEVIKSLIEQGQIYRDGDKWGRKETHELAIPQSVKEAIGRRLTRLREPTVEVLRTAAALGKVFPFRELAAASLAEEDALLDALDEATAAQLIRTNSGGPGAPTSSGDDNFAFTHDKIREVLYEELNPIRRRRLHQRIGEALEKLHDAAALDGEVTGAGADLHAQDLAHHFMQAGDLPRSLAYARRAARNATRVFALDEALKFLEQARESAEALHLDGELARIDELIGDTLDARGLVQPAIQSFELALTRLASKEARAAIHAKIGAVYCWIGDSRGLAHLERALEDLDPATQTIELATATAFTGRYYHYRAQHRKAIEFLERARLLAEPCGDTAPLSNIYTFLAGANQHLLAYDESDRWARAGIALGERMNDPQGIAGGNEFLAENAAGRGVWDDALVYAELDRSYGVKSGSLAREAWAAFAAVLALHGKGRLAEGRDRIQSALALCQRIGELRLATWCEPMLAVILADLGDDEAARAHAEHGWERAQQLDQLVLTGWSLHAVGHAAMQRGDVAEALKWYDIYIPLVRDTENGVVRIQVLAWAAEAFLAGGRSDDAMKLVNEEAEIAEFARAPHFIALAARVRGQILAATGDDDNAVVSYDRAVKMFRQLGSRLELARAMHHRAALQWVHGSAEEKAAARVGAAEARDAFAAMGAIHDQALSDRLLAR